MNNGACKVWRWAAGWLVAGMVLVSGSSGMVLCIGDDGHLAVEPEYHRHAAHSHEDAVQTHAEKALSDTGCASCDLGGCVDVPLGSDALSHAAKSLRQDRLLKNRISKDVSAHCLAPASVDGQGPQRPAHGATTPRLSQSLLAQRTVVLRI